MVLGGVFFKSFTQNSSSFVFFAVFFRGAGGRILFFARGVHVRCRRVVLQSADEFENHAQVPALQRRVSH